MGRGLDRAASAQSAPSIADAREEALLERVGCVRLTHEARAREHAHAAHAGELTPGRLSARLQLSSVGTIGLIHRMQRAGRVTRDGHARDGRSAVLRLTPEIHTWAADAWAPPVAEIDSLVHELSINDAHVVQGFLEAVADAAERHANRLAADADAAAHDALLRPATTTPHLAFYMGCCVDRRQGHVTRGRHAMAAYCRRHSRGEWRHPLIEGAAALRPASRSGRCQAVVRR